MSFGKLSESIMNHQRNPCVFVLIIFNKRKLVSKVKFIFCWVFCIYHLDRVKRIWYLSPMRAAKVHASLRIRAVSPEPPLLANASSESRGTFRQKARSLSHLNGWACAVKICHDGMLEDTNSLDGAHLSSVFAVWLLKHYVTFRRSQNSNDNWQGNNQLYVSVQIIKRRKASPCRLCSHDYR